MHTQTIISMASTSASLLPELQGIVLSYLCPTDDPDAVFMLNTKFKTLSDWSKSLEVTTNEIMWNFLCKVTRVNGKIHRSSDDKRYFNGKFHNDNPALEFADGEKRWYINGILHRTDDKPAIEFLDGDKHWYINGVLQRDGDRPAIERKNGDKYWYVNGVLHRDGDRPAIERANGKKYWYINGVLHRDGNKPVIELANEDKYCLN